MTRPARWHRVGGVRRRCSAALGTVVTLLVTGIPGLAPAADRTLKINPADDNQPEPTPWEEGEELPEFHSVNKGDTLWGIAQQYFGEPWQWPKLWARNPTIANPHWIFPDQLIRLRDPTVVRAAAGQPPTGAAAGGGRSRISTSGVPKTAGTGAIRQLGFVTEEAFRRAGSIVGSLEEKLLLASGDQAYVEYPPGHPPKPGDRFTIYSVDTSHPLREPKSELTLGYLVHIHGEVVVDELTDRPFATGRLVNLVGPVERGYRAGPEVRQFKIIAPKVNQVSMTARIIAGVSPEILIGNEMFVVLNRGVRHGVETGNRFQVLRQGDGVRRFLESWDAMDHRFPTHVIAEIIAVDVQNETTIGWIAQGSRELRIGDVADMPLNH